MRTVPWLLSCLVAAAPLRAGDAPRARKPRLEIRATPRMAFSPVEVRLTAELRGGDAGEDLHCPAVEWDWDDGGRSVRESDCAPFEPGTVIDRRFTAAHAYRGPGVYSVKVTLKRLGRAVASAATTVHVRSSHGAEDTPE